MRCTVAAVGLALTLLGAAATRLSSQSVAAALIPLPEQLRDKATVVRLNASFRPEVLRAGTNGMVCIADAPNDDKFDVRCYRDTFMPVVYRTFQLGYDVAGPKVGAEIQAGTLRLSREPTAGYRCLGPISGYDALRNRADTRIECWQSIHFPFRTATDVGFPDERDVPESRQLEIPYVMASGTYWSHVMIRHATVHARMDSAVEVATAPLSAQPDTALRPVADHHAHLQSRASWWLFHESLPVVAIPDDIDRLLRAFERGWQSLDKSNIAALFTEDGMMQWADDWARGRRAIRIALLGKSGALRLRAQVFETHDSLGVVAGAYGFYRDTTWVDQGRYVLSLRKARGAEWQIAVAFLSNTTPAVPPVGDPITADHLIAQLDSVGIRRAAVLSLAYQFGAPYRRMTDELAKVRAENDWVGQQVGRYPGRLVGFCSFNPLATYALEELARCGRIPNISGVKLHFTNSDVELRNREHVERLRSVFRAANALRFPIVVHMRTLDPTYGRQDAEVFLRDLLAEAPDIPVQIAHLAGWGGYGPETDQALGVFADAIAAGDRRTTNLYFDLSAVVSRGFSTDTKQLIVKRIRQIGIRRVLFAVDGAEPPWTVWANVMTLPLETAELRTIAGNLAPYFR
jgi:predicted TIM-barrel fold metal-dependent hydrolase